MQEERVEQLINTLDLYNGKECVLWPLPDNNESKGRHYTKT
jgi:hypothetical protein